ncbi:S41 family peptidase [Proteiniphilum acetatigenes]|uniref:S41 family peptidase n=1 Tax=Proteiniphilum acetatigenes TaxID=294710 RepID=UPI00035EEF8E|nr:S41 family peptidase [Proteiniphilum acetatigenes]
MKRVIFTVIVLGLTLSSSCQTKEIESKFNFGFEKIENGKPTGWYNFGSADYQIYLDSVSVKSGKYSAVIEYGGETSNYKALAFTLPHNYEGKQITLSGYIKTENVADGYAGLWMRIDPGIAFDNMHQRGITGTTDWKKYEVTLQMNPSETEQIVIGGLLVGKGKMWLDDFSITIDGKDIKDAQTYKKEEVPADKDREFDNGSNIIFPVLDEQLMTNLELLGKLWGFLKYHHPAAGKGDYNWDYELFRILPEYLNAGNNNRRDKILLTWIEKYGEIPACETCKETLSDAYLKPDLSWVDNSNMDITLKKRIKDIYMNRHQGKHYYIAMFPGVGNPEFKNEKPYSNTPYPDAGFRLLSLYKYWNMIQYFFPNKHLTDKNWNDVLKEYIPLFLSAKNELEYELVSIQVIGEVNDTHANLWGGKDKVEELRGNMYAPFKVRFIEEKLVVTDYYNPELKESAGLEIGDVITHIDGKTTELIVDSLKKYYPASNEAARLRDISADLLRSQNQVVNVKYVSSGQIKQKELILYPRANLNMYHWYRVNKDEKCYKLLDGNIGYVTLASINNEDVPVIKETFKDTKGIIIDIRNYPSAFMPFSLAPYFVSSPTPFVKFTNGNINNPGEFTFSSDLNIPGTEEIYQGKLVVLVNELTQSSAEYTAMSFRAGENTTIVGSTTAGADGNVSTIVLPGGLRTMISGIGVYYPDGKETQRIGIVPDVKIEPTINGIKAGRDEVLEKAIEIINEQ